MERGETKSRNAESQQGQKRDKLGRDSKVEARGFREKRGERQESVREERMGEESMRQGLRR